jgi:uncharacterized membrane protein YdjX (TVP38/TMEM64 family)
MTRLILIFIGLAALVSLPFLLVGHGFEELMGGGAGLRLLLDFGRWAWLAGLVLLTLDLFLPVPATGIMAALGAVYGPLQGGTLAALGSFIAGSLGYGLCRLLGPPAAKKLLGPTGLSHAEHRFDAIGAWLVVLSRALPVLPEVVVCMAGLLGMPARRFFPALLCGSLPIGFTMAGLGAVGSERPLLTLAIATLVPAGLWFLLRRQFAGSRPADPALAEQRQPEAAHRQNRGHARPGAGDQGGVQERDPGDQRHDRPGHRAPAAGTQP